MTERFRPIFGAQLSAVFLYRTDELLLELKVVYSALVFV